MKTVKIYLILFVLCSIIACEAGNKNQGVNGSHEWCLIEAASILDSMNALPKEDLVKMNTRGCVGNCWPRETTEKLFRYLTELEKIECFVSWDSTSQRYFIEDKETIETK